MPEEPSSSHPSLTVLGGPMAGTQFVLDQAVDNVLIGSDASCRFCLSVPGVSPVHARIWVDENGITLYSAHSPKELFVNDDVVTDHVALNNGDVIWLGSPGDEQSVMIQCRVPPRDARETAESSEAIPASISESQTMALPREDVVASLQRTPYPPAPQTTPIPDGSAPPPEFEEELGETEPPPTTPLPPATTPVPRPTPAPRPPATTPIPRSTPAPPATTPVPKAAQAQRPLATRPAVRPTATPPHRPVPRHPLARPPKRAASRSSGKLLALAVVILALAGGGFAAWFYVLRPRGITTPVAVAPTPRPTQAPIASPLPTYGEDLGTAAVDVSPTPESGQETPEPIEVVTLVNTPTPPRETPAPTKTPKPTPKPAATQPPDDVQAARRADEIGGLMDRARQAAAAGRYQEAASLFDRVLQLDPRDSSAASGKADAENAAASLSRRFMPGRTVVVTKSGRADLSGFDTGDVRVAKAPDYSGHIDFQAAPERVKPGDPFAIKVTLTNDGRKDYRLASILLTTTQNSEQTGGPIRPPSQELRTKRSITLAEHKGTWEKNIKSWRMDVKVTTSNGDEFSSTLSWR